MMNYHIHLLIYIDILDQYTIILFLLILNNFRPTSVKLIQFYFLPLLYWVNIHLMQIILISKPHY